MWQSPTSMEGQSTTSRGNVCNKWGRKIRGSRFHLARHLRKCSLSEHYRLCHICGLKLRGPKCNFDQHIKHHSVPPTRNQPPSAPQSDLEEDPLEGPSRSLDKPRPLQERADGPSPSQERADGPSPDLFSDTSDHSMQDTPLHPELRDIPESFWVPWSQLPPTPPPAGTSTETHAEAAINWEQDKEIEIGSQLLPENARDDLKEIDTKHFPAFRTGVRTGKVQNMYTFRHLPEGVNWHAALKDIFRLQNCS